MASVSHVKNVSGTAFVVAEFRAEENWEAAPLYHDPIVGLFLDQESRNVAAQMADRFPHMKDLVKVRTKYFDGALDRQIEAGFEQVVILGAGLDTRAVRKAAAGVRYFEIDDPATLSLKQECYAREGIGADVTFIPGNYVTDGLIDLLERHGFDFEVPTYFIWEGNTMYLPVESVKDVVSELRRYVRRFRLSFDYMSDAVIANTTGDAGIARMVASFAAMGAPWVTGIADAGAFARDMRLSLIENFKTMDLYRTYGITRPVTSSIFEFYSVCTLGF